MSEARINNAVELIKADWNRTASLMAIVANANRDKKKRAKPFTANDFNPFAKPAGNVEVGLESLKGFL